MVKKNESQNLQKKRIKKSLNRYLKKIKYKF
jgi:hypothetical protein